MVHHGYDDDNVIVVMITWHHSMMIVYDCGIIHGMNDVKSIQHGMTWHGDGTKCGKKWHFRGQKWAKKGVARGMAKLHRKIRLLECARGGVFGVARGGAEIAVFGDFGDGGNLQDSGNA